MAQYTEEFLAAARHGYENTDQPMRELARELGIGITTLSTLAEKNGWAKRSKRRRGLPPAMQLLAEAQALAKASAHSRASGNPEEELGPRFRGDEREESALPPSLLSEKMPPTPDPSPPVAALLGGGEKSAPSRQDLYVMLEHILAQLITAEAAAVGNGIRSPQSARTLATLTAAMRALNRTDGAASPHAGPTDDDDELPRDLDEFRVALARRIEAVFANETDATLAQDNSGRADPGGAE